jgi:hypothetical protein
MLQGQPSEGRNVPPNYLELVRDASYRALIIQRLTENVAKMKRARAVTQSTGQGHILAPESGLDGKGHFYGAAMPVSLRHQRTLDSLYEQRLSVGFCADPTFHFCHAALRSLAGARAYVEHDGGAHGRYAKLLLLRLVTSAYLRCFVHPRRNRAT